MYPSSFFPWPLGIYSCLMKVILVVRKFIRTVRKVKGREEGRREGKV